MVVSDLKVFVGGTINSSDGEGGILGDKISPKNSFLFSVRRFVRIPEITKSDFLLIKYCECIYWGKR